MYCLITLHEIICMNLFTKYVQWPADQPIPICNLIIESLYQNNKVENIKTGAG